MLIILGSIAFCVVSLSHFQRNLSNLGKFDVVADSGKYDIYISE